MSGRKGVCHVNHGADIDHHLLMILFGINPLEMVIHSKTSIIH